MAAGGAGAHLALRGRVFKLHRPVSDIERNRSTIAFYDFRRRRAELGVVRAF